MDKPREDFGGSLKCKGGHMAGPGWSQARPELYIFII